MGRLNTYSSITVYEELEVGLSMQADRMRNVLLKIYDLDDYITWVINHYRFEFRVESSGETYCFSMNQINEIEAFVNGFASGLRSSEG